MFPVVNIGLCLLASADDLLIGERIAYGDFIRGAIVHLESEWRNIDGNGNIHVVGVDVWK